MVVDKRLCLIIKRIIRRRLVLFDEHAQGREACSIKSDCHHTELHILRTLCSPDLRFASLVNVKELDPIRLDPIRL